jgi:PBP1b-binding outer membrane lipoprotein LpoB
MPAWSYVEPIVKKMTAALDVDSRLRTAKLIAREQAKLNGKLATAK